jgi:hypothetical protein
MALTVAGAVQRPGAAEPLKASAGEGWQATRFGNVPRQVRAWTMSQK